MGAEIKQNNHVASLQTAGNSPEGQTTHQGCRVHGSIARSTTFQLLLSGSPLQDFQGRDTLSLPWERASSFQPLLGHGWEEALAPGRHYSNGLV